jgi:hypothetical protein
VRCTRVSSDLAGADAHCTINHMSDTDNSIMKCAAMVLTASVVLNNTQLPLDTTGNLLVTGEATVLQVASTYYFYFNNWGGCPGVDCCTSITGCASCCFNPPSPQYPDACVYTNNHSVVVYSTSDFSNWDYLGVALPLANRVTGIEFRPQVVYNAASKLYIMWYEDRWSGQTGYAVATSPVPQGPFTTIANTVKVQGIGRVGDYDLFVDDDGQAYQARTGLTIEKLAPNYTATTGVVYNMSNPNVEAPTMFKRNGIYYLLAGVGCCGCIGGSNIEVYTATSPLGPYTYAGDVGTNTSQAFNAFSPLNYVTHAQASKVFTVPAADGSLQYVWLGNQWVTSQQPGNPRNHDLLYWSIIQFDETGGIQQFVHQDSIVLSLP